MLTRHAPEPSGRPSAGNGSWAWPAYPPASKPALREDCSEETGSTDPMDPVVDPWEGERM